MIVELSYIRSSDTDSVGRTAARLGERLRNGVEVAPGFVVTADDLAELAEREQLPARLEGASPEEAAAIAAEVIGAAELPADLVDDLAGSIAALGRDAWVSVQASPAGRDLGVSREVLGPVRGADATWELVRRVWASLWAPEAVARREEKGVADAQDGLAVLVQRAEAPAEPVGAERPAQEELPVEEPDAEKPDAEEAGSEEAHEAESAEEVVAEAERIEDEARVVESAEIIADEAEPAEAAEVIVEEAEAAETAARERPAGTAAAGGSTAPDDDAEPAGPEGPAGTEPEGTGAEPREPRGAGPAEDGIVEAEVTAAGAPSEETAGGEPAGPEEPSPTTAVEAGTVGERADGRTIGGAAEEPPSGEPGDGSGATEARGSTSAEGGRPARDDPGPARRRRTAAPLIIGVLLAIAVLLAKRWRHR